MTVMTPREPYPERAGNASRAKPPALRRLQGLVSSAIKHGVSP